MLTLTVFLGIMVPAWAQFMSAPTFDLTASDMCAGATATYTFHLSNPDGVEIAAVSILWPAWPVTENFYSQLLLSYGLVDTYGGILRSGSGYLAIRVTLGVFDLYNEAGQLVGTLTQTIATTGALTDYFTHSTTATFLTFRVPLLLSPGAYVDFVLPTVLNPEPGLYVFSAEATTVSGQTVNMNSRPGYTNQVSIVDCGIPSIDAPAPDGVGLWAS
jgi:hypothetical protein